MKTIKEWFELIKDPQIRTELFENISINSNNSEQESLSLAIFSAFVWEHSPQGNEYWRDIDKRAQQGKIELIKEAMDDIFYKSMDDIFYKSIAGCKGSLEQVKESFVDYDKAWVHLLYCEENVVKLNFKRKQFNLKIV